MQLRTKTCVINRMPKAVLQGNSLNSIEEYSQRILEWKVKQLLTYLGIQNRSWKNLLDVVFAGKCFTLRRNFWNIVLAIVFLRLTTYLVCCVDLQFKVLVVKVQSTIQISFFM